LLFRVETYIIYSPPSGDDADGDDVVYNRSFYLLGAAKCCVSFK